LLFVLSSEEDEGLFYLSRRLKSKKVHNRIEKSLEGTSNGLRRIQRVGNWWKAYMLTDREKDPEAARRNRVSESRPLPETPVIGYAV